MTESTSEPLPPLNAGYTRLILGRVLRRRCPQCGVGRLSESYSKLRGGCSECGLVYRREQGSQTGSMYLTAAVNQLFAVALIGSIWVFTEWTATTSILTALPLALTFSYLFLPWSQALWVGVEYMTDWGNREDWVKPHLPD